MEIYLVGGAVRDQVLNISNSKDRDWVVVGAKPEYFIERGYQQVGKDFPVFLHPETNEEYALARVERKIQAGHTGFECYFDDSVTLEQDLSRRDLTINAMAMNADGEIVDPYGGLKDCKDKILRHVSPAFVEDPLRCLRIARFAAQLPGFVLAKETLELCKSMVANNDLKYLSKERIWQEWHKALESKDPNSFFQVMRLIGALELEVQSNFHSLEANSELRLALLASDIKDINVILETIKPPKKHSSMALLCNKLSALNAPTCAYEILNIIKTLDAYRQPERIKKFLSIMPASKKISNWNENLIRTSYEQTSNIDVQEILSQGFSGVEIMYKLDEKRLQIIDNLIINDRLL